MQLARVIGDVVVTRKDENLASRTLLILQPIGVDGAADRAVARGGRRREVLQPVLPAAAEPVDVHDGALAAAELDVVDGLAADLHRARGRGPVDAAPAGLRGHAVELVGAARGTA